MPGARTSLESVRTFTVSNAIPDCLICSAESWAPVDAGITICDADPGFELDAGVADSLRLVKSHIAAITSTATLNAVIIALRFFIAAPPGRQELPGQPLLMRSRSGRDD